MKKKMKGEWSLLPSELLERVMWKLDLLDIPRFGLVCSSWHSVSKLPPLLALYPRPLSPPISGLRSAIIYPDEYSEKFQENYAGTLRLWSPDHMKTIHYLPLGKKRSFWGPLKYDHFLVGSSHGWMIFQQEDRINGVMLYNPFSGSRIRLPRTCFKGEIKKAILTRNPYGGSNYNVVIIYNDYKNYGNLAYCSREGRSWRASGYLESFTDVACYDNKVYAITLRDGIGIFGWDFSYTNPIQTSQIFVPSFPKELNDLVETFGIEKDRVQFYLVPSSEDTLLVARLLGTLDKGKTTLAFQVFKVKFDEQKLVNVESLADQCIFLGRSQSIAISARRHGLKENSIYFIYYDNDDQPGFYLNRSVGGHEIGIYSLNNRRISWRCDLDQYMPLPFWLFPQSL